MTEIRSAICTESLRADSDTVGLLYCSAPIFDVVLTRDPKEVVRADRAEISPMVYPPQRPHVIPDACLDSRWLTLEFCLVELSIELDSFWKQTSR